MKLAFSAFLCLSSATALTVLAPRDDSKILKLDFSITKSNGSTNIGSTGISAMNSLLLQSESSESQTTQSSSTQESSTTDSSEVSDKDIVDTIVTVQNKNTFYSVELSLGSDNQTVECLLDTGSSDLWVSTKKLSSASGKFNPQTSSSFKNLTDSFGIAYGDGTYAKGHWAQDYINFNGMVLDMDFGVADNTTASQSVLGIGMVGLESRTTSYNNLPVVLKQSGYISKTTYSLYLNSAEASSGSILFGAIDKAKFTGELVELDLMSVSDSGTKTTAPVAFFVELLNATYNGNDFSESKTYPALLDSGTTLIYAPESVYENYGKKFGWHVPGLGYVNKCDEYSGQKVAFHFDNNLKIEVPVDDLMYPLYHKNGKPWKTLFKRKNICLVGIMKTSSDVYILGDSFLRSAYVNFDIENKKIGMAQVRYTNDTEVVSY